MRIVCCDEWINSTIETVEWKSTIFVPSRLLLLNSATFCWQNKTRIANWDGATARRVRAFLLSHLTSHCCPRSSHRCESGTSNLKQTRTSELGMALSRLISTLRAVLHSFLRPIFCETNDNSFTKPMIHRTPELVIHLKRKGIAPSCYSSCGFDWSLQRASAYWLWKKTKQTVTHDVHLPDGAMARRALVILNSVRAMADRQCVLGTPVIMYVQCILDLERRESHECILPVVIDSIQQCPLNSLWGVSRFAKEFNKMHWSLLQTEWRRKRLWKRPVRELLLPLLFKIRRLCRAPKRIHTKSSSSIPWVASTATYCTTNADDHDGIQWLNVCEDQIELVF